MKKEDKKSKMQPFDGLLAEAAPEARAAFEAFYTECMKLAGIIESGQGLEVLLTKQPAAPSNADDEKLTPEESGGNSGD